jgi:hypothetical protein
MQPATIEKIKSKLTFDPAKESGGGSTNPFAAALDNYKKKVDQKNLAKAEEYIEKLVAICDQWAGEEKKFEDLKKKFDKDANKIFAAIESIGRPARAVQEQKEETAPAAE